MTGWNFKRLVFARWRLLLVLAVVVSGATAVSFTLGGTGVDATDTGPFESNIQFAEVASERGFSYSASQEDQFGNGRVGVYVSDYTNNGYPDILAIGGERPVLFRNTGGEFEPSGELPAFDSTIKGAVFFDHDNDGWDDLVLLPLHDSPIFLENVGGSYVERDVGLGEVTLTVPSSAHVADYNANGCLDLFITQNGNWLRSTPMKEIEAEFAYTGQRPPADIEVEDDNGGRNYLLEGSCGRFVDVTDDVGIDGTRWSTSASFVDLTGNGYPDLHVANDFNYDYLYVNQEGTSFEARTIPETNRHAMSSEVADFTGNGQLDIFVTNIYIRGESLTQQLLESMDNSGNNLLINDNGTFHSQEHQYGVRDGGWGWAAVAVDLDNDGERDLVHATQYYWEDLSTVVRTEPKLWAGDGDRFVALNASERGFEVADGRGLANLDFNGNGAQDLVVANLAGEFKLYENRYQDGNWLQLSVASAPGTPAIGTTVRVHAADRTYQTVTHSNTDFQSQGSQIVHLGLGSVESVTVEVEWVDGTVHRHESVTANQRIMVQPDGTVTHASHVHEPAVPLENRGDA